MKVLITGSEGQVGSFLSGHFSQANWQVLALGRAMLDISDFDKVLKAVTQFEPDIIVNAAAYTAVDKAESEVELAYSVNCEGAANLAKAAAMVGAALLHISTDYVFSGKEQGKYSEKDLTDPQGAYGSSKLAGEQAVVKACERHIIVRTAWVFGEQGGNFVKTMLRLGQTHEELRIVGDQYGGPTYAGDISRVLLKISERIISGQPIEWGVYHYSGYPHVSWCEFAKAIFDKAVEKRVFEKSPKLDAIATEEYPTPAKRPANSRLDTRKIEKALSIGPSNWLSALENIEAYMAAEVSK